MIVCINGVELESMTLLILDDKLIYALCSEYRRAWWQMKKTRLSWLHVGYGVYRGLLVRLL